MTLKDLLKDGAVFSGLRPASKKQALHLISIKAAARCGLKAEDVLDAIMERERLGSTGVGNGVAIPHARCAGLNEITGFFFRLDAPVDFEAIDDVPVDLIFLLLAPEGDGAGHLRSLAQVSRMLRRQDLRQKIRNTANEDAILALLTGVPHSNAA